MVQLAALLGHFESLWPIEGAESWDAPGLITGSPLKNVHRVLLSVDVTSEVVEAAVNSETDLLISHHPYLMRGVKNLAENTAKGSVIATAIRANLAMFAAHTNADIVVDGVSDVLAKCLGLSNPLPLVPISNTTGTGRVGQLSEVISLGEFAAKVARALPNTASGVRVSGDYNRLIERVAVCGGAGDAFIDAAFAAGADVYVTSDLRHHVTQDAGELARLSGGPALIDISHWAAEFLWLEVAAEQLRRIYPELTVEVCDLRSDPWDFVVTQ